MAATIRKLKNKLLMDWLKKNKIVSFNMRFEKVIEAHDYTKEQWLSILDFLFNDSIIYHNDLQSNDLINELYDEDVKHFFNSICYIHQGENADGTYMILESIDDQITFYDYDFSALNSHILKVTRERKLSQLL